MLFAAEEAAGGPKRFAAWNVDPAMCARNHRLDRGRRGALPALADKTGNHEVNDDYCDDEKEDLAHAAMAGRLRRGTRRGAIIPARDESPGGGSKRALIHNGVVTKRKQIGPRGYGNASALGSE